MKAVLQEELLFPTGEAPRSKPWTHALVWEFRELKELYLTLSCQDATPNTNTGRYRSPKQPRLPSLTPSHAHQGLMGSLCSWPRASGETWRWAVHGDEHCPLRAEHCPSSCAGCAAFPKVLSKSWQANAEYENRQEKPSWSFSGMQTISWALLFFCTGESYLNCIRLFEIPRCRALCSQAISVAITIPTFLSPNTLLQPPVTPCFGKVWATCKSQGRALLHAVSCLMRFSEYCDRDPL